MSGRDALSSLLLLLLVTAPFHAWAPSGAGGPLAPATGAAIAHAALLGPALGASAAAALLGPAFALPAMAAASYGRGAPAFLASALLLLLAALSGAAAVRIRRTALAGLYLPSTLLLFVAPPVLDYLAREFDPDGGGERWGLLSPVAAAERAASGGGAHVAASLLLLVWPVLALAIPARRDR